MIFDQNTIHQDPSCGSTKIHHVDPPRSIKWIVDLPGSIKCIHQDPPCGFTMFHQVDPPGSITWIHQDFSRGATMIHDPWCGYTRIHHVNPPGSIMWIHQDLSCGSVRIHNVNIPGNHHMDSHGSTRIHHHQDPSWTLPGLFPNFPVIIPCLSVVYHLIIPRSSRDIPWIIPW